MPVEPGSGFVLGVLSIFQPEPRFHFSHKRAVLLTLLKCIHVFLLVVVCHGGDLLKAAQLRSSVCIMETCLSRHPGINQVDVSPSVNCIALQWRSRVRSVNVENRPRVLVKWAVRAASADVRNSAHMIICRSHLHTFPFSSRKHACVSCSVRILHVPSSPFPF